MAAPIPLVAYNPPNARKVLSPAEWNRIASSVKGVAGIKVAGGDEKWHAAMRPVAERLSVFVAGIRLASGMIHGCASGSYSNVACLSPKGASQWGALIREDPNKALEREERIQAVFKTALAPHRERFSHAALDKALAAAGGWTPIAPAVRWPLSSISFSDTQRLSATFRQGLPFLFEDLDRPA